MAQFAAQWVQTLSDYDFLVASTMNAEWAEEHRPVISRNGHGHILYTRYRFFKPYGQRLVCPKICEQQLLVKTHDNNFRIICTGCKARTSIPKHDGDWKSTLGRKTFVKTIFPQEIYPASWKLNDTEDAGQPNLATGLVLFSADHTPTISTHLAVPQPLLRTASSPPAPMPSPGPSSSRLPSTLTIRVPPKPPAHTIARSKSTPNITNRANIVPAPSTSIPSEASTDPRKRQSGHRGNVKQIKRQKK